MSGCWKKIPPTSRAIPIAAPVLTYIILESRVVLSQVRWVRISICCHREVLRELCGVVVVDVVDVVVEVVSSASCWSRWLASEVLKASTSLSPVNSGDEAERPAIGVDIGMSKFSRRLPFSSSA